MKIPPPQNLPNSGNKPHGKWVFKPPSGHEMHAERNLAVVDAGKYRAESRIH